MRDAAQSFSQQRKILSDDIRVVERKPAKSAHGRGQVHSLKGQPSASAEASANSENGKVGSAAHGEPRERLARGGGHGYVDLHRAACATNLMLDGVVFRACCQVHADKVVYASSGCVYPNHLQTDLHQILYLTEDMMGPPYDVG